MIAVAHLEFDRLQAGHTRGQRQPLGKAGFDPLNACCVVAVRGWYAPQLSLVSHGHSCTPLARHSCAPVHQPFPIQIGRSQTGHRLQRGLVPPKALQNEIWLCDQTAVQGGSHPLQTNPPCTAIFGASTSAPALARHFAPCSSVTPWPAPRQRHQVACAAHRSGKTVYASAAQPASAGKTPHRTGDAA